MRILAEVTWVDEEGEEPKTMKEKYWLLHFGLKCEIINDIGVSYTVCICENYKTGQLETFDPSQVKIIGTELKK
jgi:hypothetical protein